METIIFLLFGSSCIILGMVAEHQNLTYNYTSIKKERKCWWIFFHDWNKWEQKEYKNTQERNCTKCNKRIKIYD